MLQKTRLVAKYRDRHNPLDGPITGPKIARTTRPDDSIEIARRCAVRAAPPWACKTTLSSSLSAPAQRHPGLPPATWRLDALLQRLSRTARHCPTSHRDS